MNCELIFWKLHGTFPILPVVNLNLPYEVESLHHVHYLIGNGMRGTIRSDAGSCFGLFVSLCLLLFLTVGVLCNCKCFSLRLFVLSTRSGEYLTHCSKL
jgi:hypothetical protein